MTDKELTMNKSHSKGIRTRKRRQSDTLLCKRRPEKGYKHECMQKTIKKSKQFSRQLLILLGPWTDDEDTLLSSLVDNLGSQKWSEIAKKIKGREGKQCRERWHNHLNPHIKKGPWSYREQWILYLVSSTTTDPT